MPDIASAFSVMAKAAAHAVRPRGRLTVSQWADNHRMLSSKGSGAPGPWRTSRNPMLREIMDSLSAHSSVKEIWVMKSSQCGVTEAAVNWFGYVMDYSPTSIMVFMPSLASRDSWKAQKLNTLLTDTKCIRDMLGGLRSRDAIMSKEMIDFPGGIMFLAGGNSPTSYDQKSVRYLVMDDLDRFSDEIDCEGDPVELARSRVKAFPNSYKMLFVSTPTVRGKSLIENGFLTGDQRYYFVACPHCGERQRLMFDHVRANEDMTEASYICTQGCIIDEYSKPAMLRGGEWVPTFPDREVRSYHISSIYAPIGLGPSWLDLVTAFKRVHKDPLKLRTWINHNLGETWEDKSDRVQPHDLAQRAGSYVQGEMPGGCVALTIGVDVQDSWLAVTVLGWGAPVDENSSPRNWVVEVLELLGDTSNPAAWNELERIINRQWSAHGKTIRPHAVGIDSRGHRTEEVKNFVTRQTFKVPVFAVQGATGHLGRAIAQTATSATKTKTGKMIPRGYQVWNVDTVHAKNFIYSNIEVDGARTPGERVFTFPQGMDEAYYCGVLSETFDADKRRYIKRPGAKYVRNEPLDTIVYAWAIAQHRSVNLGRTRRGEIDFRAWQRLSEEESAPVAATTSTASLLGGWGRG